MESPTTDVEMILKMRVLSELELEEIDRETTEKIKPIYDQIAALDNEMRIIRNKKKELDIAYNDIKNAQTENRNNVFKRQSTIEWEYKRRIIIADLKATTPNTWDHEQDRYETPIQTIIHHDSPFFKIITNIYTENMYSRRSVNCIRSKTTLFWHPKYARAINKLMCNVFPITTSKNITTKNFPTVENATTYIIKNEQKIIGETVNFIDSLYTEIENEQTAFDELFDFRFITKEDYLTRNHNNNNTYTPSTIAKHTIVLNRCKKYSSDINYTFEVTFKNSNLHFSDPATTEDIIQVTTALKKWFHLARWA